MRVTYKTGDDSLLKEILDFRDYSWNRWEKNRKEGDLDMKALSVKGPWPEAELTAREDKDNPRPHGHTDIISPYNNRVVNQARMNPRGVEVIPKSMGADAKTAETRENRLRAIDYECHASQARLTALQNAVDRGVGYWRVDTEYDTPRSRNLKIVIKRIPNVNAILDDPDCQEADRSDRKKFIIAQWINNDDAKRRWKNLKDPKSFSVEQLASAVAWIRPNQMLFAEYWKVIEEEERVLFLDDTPEGVFESELPDRAKIERVKTNGEILSRVVYEDGTVKDIQDERKGMSKRVMQYFTNGLQIFEEKEWPGSTIPFPTCVGREKYEQDELVIESLTRKMREPQLGFDLARASEDESIAMTPKSKYLISDRAIQGYEEQWKMAHRNPQAYLKYHERDEDGEPVSKPERIDYEPQVAAFEEAAASRIRDAQNAAGMTGVDQKQRQQESGVAQEKIDEAADISSFHFIDSWLLAIEFEGRIENELLDVIEDSERVVGMRSKDGKYSVQKMTPQQLPDGSVQHPYGKSDGHAVTISTGPNYQSQLQEAKDFADTLAKIPEFALPLGPLIIDLKQMGPTGDKMKDVLIALLQPNVAAAYQNGEDGQPVVPPQAQQSLQKAGKVIQALNAHAQQMEQQIAQLTQKLQAQDAQNQSRERIASDDNQTKIQVAEINASVKERMNALDAQLVALKHISDVLTGHIQMQNDAKQAELARQAASGSGTNMLTSQVGE